LAGSASNPEHVSNGGQSAVSRANSQLFLFERQNSPLLLRRALPPDLHAIS
jgi:hypothetical protein